MAYFDSYNKNTWHELGLSYDMLRPYPLTESEITRSCLLANELIARYETRTLDDAEEMTLGTVLQNAAMVYYNFGMHVNAKNAVSILKRIQYQDNRSNNVENLTVQSMLIRTGAFYAKQPHYIEVPKVFTSTSIPFMVHEISHMLKEVNPCECRGVYTDLEVIPILLEMISAQQNKDNNVFKKRELLMLDIAKSFDALNDDRLNNRIKNEDTLAFNACYRQHILYLNSFYYSLRLFKMYLEAPQYVLGIINDVLSGRITTKQVIDNYLNNNGYSYDSGMEEFRKRLK